ncbi:MAG: polyprenyl synthetase family protein [Nitrospiraceae bacterium]|nr:polyprenyl synthetase family protein [Nitrospiraceae bacterium]
MISEKTSGNFDLKGYLSSRAAMVDGYLEEYFGFGVLPAVLRESMYYSISAGGKRIRPVLALASYEALGGSPQEILRYACALELIHTYSLIHDDLPAMDDDDLRRGKPTNHKVYGEAVAILAGDGLLTEAFHMLSVPENGIGADRLLKAIEDVSMRAGLWGMVAGQVQDILAEAKGSGAMKDPEHMIKFIHEHKTAQLLAASVRMGGILAGASHLDLDALTVYGRAIGIAFQVMDDILDIKGQTALMGKTAGSDSRKEKLTWPGVFGLERAEAEARQLVESAIASVGAFGAKAEPLAAIARYIIDRDR